MRSCAQFLDEARRVKKYRSDRELGELCDCTPQAIGAARRGKMTDPIAIKIAEVVGVPPGEVLMVARMERERDPTVRKHLESWTRAVGKALASIPGTVVSVAVALTMGWGLAPDASASVGGAGGFRRRASA